MKTPLAIAISSALLSGAVQAGNLTIKGHSPEILAVEQYHSEKNQVHNLYQDSIIIELETPSIAKAFGSSGERLGNQLQQIRQHTQFNSHVAKIAAEQNRVISQLRKAVPGLKVQKQFDTVFNGMSISSANLDIETLKQIPGIKAIYPDTMHHIQMDASLSVINTDAIWQAVNGMENAGKGMRVAIIDGGIRPENPMFSGDGFTAPANLPDNDYCATTDSSFCNDKLIVARWSAPNFAVCADEYMSPLGYGGHGTHVAGTAVGNQVTTEYEGIEVTLSGVAPAAYLMSYKALYSRSDCSGGSGTDTMLMEALEYAVEDGADVINNSWGGSTGANPAGSPYKAIFEAAEAAGIVVVSAAGNSGNGAKTIGCPACIESGIAVANSTAGRFFANNFNFDGKDMLAVNSNSSAVFAADITAPVITAMGINADNVEGCDPFAADSFTDGIALISRGSCNFSTKADNAANAGAKAIVVYNNNDGAPISMYMPDTSIPGLMISNKDGKAVEMDAGNNAQGTLGVAVKRVVDSNFADMISASSSRGPNGDENIFKPDIAAPGSSILSAASPDTDGGDFGFKSGTSMASPHVAGAAAILKQMRPSWSAVDIKTALMSTAATDDIRDDDNKTPATPFDMGAGRMDLAAAANAVLTFDKASITTDSCVTECTFKRTVHNKSDAATSWTLTADVKDADVEMMPATLELAAGESAEITVKFNTSMSTSGEWVFGKLNFTGAAQDAHLPVAVLAKDSSNSNLISTTEVGTDLNAADPFEIKATLSNVEFTDDELITMQVKIPAETKMTAANDVSIMLTNATQTGSEVNVDQGRVTWVGTLAEPSMSAQSVDSGVGTFSLVEDMSTPIRSCNGGCDEISVTYTLPAFMYNGESYNKITVSDNGMIIVGGGNTSGTWRNRALPDATEPNNILAPFWSDFDLAGTATNDTGGGGIAAAVLTRNGNDYVVIEWNRAQLWGDTSGNTYTFLAWIRLGTEEDIFFTYPRLANMPSSVSVGAENISGTVGANYHYNGDGATINNGNSVAINSSVGGKVEITYKVQATANTPASDDMVTLDEDSNAEFNVLTNDGTDFKLSTTSVTNGKITAKAQRLIPVNAAGDMTAALVDQPMHGKVTLAADGSAVYTPTADFFGTDSFTYRVDDATDLVAEKTTVMLKVENINDAPVLAAATVTAEEGNNVTVAVKATDVDGDALSYTWSQTSGTSVDFTQSGDAISFTAPAPGELVFSVTASDGTVASEPVNVTVTVNAKPVVDDDGGALGWIATLLLPLAFIRRKRAA
ncbi:hypothetical protein NFHSH190041_07500 [Shewanella sp. NFH-SH190041]|uniref:S8 family serine peptidase n=1 Tax=Shewanella sp. NFH-SH190041 TaxID=2950245 RepID=UPI0021C43630|nr:S8 family serine peptidase [Shewanella sp. NFH-SH190041]BDM63298.1 hypothetical protein NFHSH190041_07500 [Shewanella sp. NFH-SH190041]